MLDRIDNWEAYLSVVQGTQAKKRLMNYRMKKYAYRAMATIAIRFVENVGSVALISGLLMRKEEYLKDKHQNGLEAVGLLAPRSLVVTNSGDSIPN